MHQRRSLTDPANGGILARRAYWLVTSQPMTLRLDGQLDEDREYTLCAEDDDACQAAHGLLDECLGDSVCQADGTCSGGGGGCQRRFNFVSYAGAEAGDLEVVLPAHVLAVIDRIVGEGQIASRLPDGSFVGSLRQLEPFHGYLFYVTESVTFSFAPVR
jgi:hypothetical protein